MRKGHIPLRRCVGCNAPDDKAKMDRFTVAQGAPRWDVREGRGAYLHRNPSCRQNFLRRKPYLRSLRTSLGKEQRAELLAESASAVDIGGSTLQNRRIAGRGIQHA